MAFSLFPILFCRLLHHMIRPSYYGSSLSSLHYNNHDFTTYCEFYICFNIRNICHVFIVHPLSAMAVSTSQDICIYNKTDNTASMPLCGETNMKQKIYHYMTSST